MSTERYLRRDVLIGAGAALAAAASLVLPRHARACMQTGKSANPDTSPAAAAGRIALADLNVNRMGYGAMQITGPEVWGNPRNPTEVTCVLRRAVELGVNFIDTADAYGPDVSELLIAQALHPYPPGLVIATKGGIIRPSAPEWVADGRPAHLRAACEASLKRLRMERIELYQLHATDDRVPLEDSVGELGRLQREGKIRHIGVSNVTVAELQRARRVVEVVAVQNGYNFVQRGSEDVLAYCEREKIVFIPHTPLARRPLAGQKNSKITALERIAKERGVSSAQAALAWVLTRSPLTLPIPGTSSVGHLEENVAAAALALTAEEMAQVG